MTIATTIRVSLCLHVTAALCLAAPARDFDITTFGAVPDGRTLNTAAIQKAVDAAAEAGGTVNVPPGVFLTGTVFLKSRVTLDLAPGAVLLGSPDIKDYTRLAWGHHEDRTPWHLIVVKDAREVVIRGAGVIDGNGAAFWEKDRPNPFSFHREIEFRPSPMIEVTGSSSHVKALGLTIRNNHYGPNSDGIDVTGSRHVIIADCDISTGDDAIALKTTEDSGACEDFAITNCVLETNCVGLRIGFESRQDFRRITASNLVIKRSTRMIDIRSVEGAVIENVSISNVVGTTNSGWATSRPIEIELSSHDNIYPIGIEEHPNFGKPKPVTRKGAIRDITLDNIDIRSDGRILMRAAQGFDASNISLSNIHFRYMLVDEPDVPWRSTSTSFVKGDLEIAKARSVIAARNIRGLVIDCFSVSPPVYPVPDTWEVLNSPHRPWPAERNDAVREGRQVPPFHVFWGRGVSGRIDLRGAAGPGAPAPKLNLADCPDLHVTDD